ncbi:VOC family protein [Albibacterium bauzanense]|uniref:PhnB protein n=1 Tax=Albibacterium bauzanense TaxID=653929 RepID=A0A4R1M5X3_9SPHI|nr:VOC family protein [Albibacterium bauzanense]TCK85143.1 PhnB protein [Albibacterium bauzanense]
MEKITLNAYLLFDGNCREAMEFYQQIFGGELQMMTFGQVDDSCPAAKKDSIMHASLMGGEVDLMASDNPEDKPSGKGNISLALSGYDEEKLRKRFSDLSMGGNIFMHLEKQIWGDLYGAFTDKFGIDWMVNIGTKK